MTGMKNSLIEEQNTWFGHLTLENLEAIARRMQTLLEGNTFTFVSVNSAFGPLTRPEVYTNQTLSQHDEGIYIHYGEDHTWGMIGVNDTYGC